MSGMTAEEREQFVARRKARLESMTEAEAYARWRAARLVVDAAFEKCLGVLNSKTDRAVEEERLQAVQRAIGALSDMEIVVRRVEKEKRR
jgi:hypothetical protein